MAEVSFADVAPHGRYDEEDSLIPDDSEVKKQLFDENRAAALKEEQMMRQAMYNSLCMCAAAVMWLALYYNYLLFRVYFTPLTWAILCSVPLRRVQARVIAEVETTESCRSTALIIFRSLFDVQAHVFVYPWVGMLRRNLSRIRKAFSGEPPNEEQQHPDDMPPQREPFQAMLAAGYVTPVRAPRTGHRAGRTKGTAKAYSTGGGRLGKNTTGKRRRGRGAGWGAGDGKGSGGDDPLGMLSGAMLLWLITSRILRWIGLGTLLLLLACLGAIALSFRILSSILRLPSLIGINRRGLLDFIAPERAKRLADGAVRQVRDPMRMWLAQNRDSLVALCIISAALLLFMACTSWACVSILYEILMAFQFFAESMHLPAAAVFLRRTSPSSGTCSNNTSTASLPADWFDLCIGGFGKTSIGGTGGSCMLEPGGMSIATGVGGGIGLCARRVFEGKAQDVHFRVESASVNETIWVAAVAANCTGRL